MLIGENRVLILETGELGDAIFTISAHAHMHLQVPQHSTPVGKLCHLMENGALILSPVTTGPT